MKKIITALLIAAAINYVLLREHETVEQKIYNASVTVSIVTNNPIQKPNPFTKELVTTHDKGDVVSTATAFHLGDGYYATAWHVVRMEVEDQQNQFDVMLMNNTGEVGSAMIAHYVKDNDVAIIYCDSLQETPELSCKDETLTIGDELIACGNGFNLGTIVSRGICSGFVLAKDAKLESVFNPLTILYVTDTAINPGSSGGPLCNADGNAVALNSAILGPSGGFDGISLHIPISHVMTSLKQAKSDYSMLLRHRTPLQFTEKERVIEYAREEKTRTDIVEE